MAKLYFRGLGPSLGTYNITRPLPDPRLALFNSQGARISENDNWRDSQQAAIEATRMPPANNLDSAIYINLNPGNYTAVMNGVGAASGIGLVEAYTLP
jgi:hypothetical protein